MNKLSSLLAPVLLAAAPTLAVADDRSGAHDFDFEFGDWQVHHRLKNADGAWYEMDGTARTQPVLGGYGNIEDNLFHRPKGDSRGLALRTYDPQAGTWAIWWVDSRAPHNPLDPPVVGKFVDGVGTFYADGDVNGRPARTRFIWSKITKTSAQWEQALSFDAGKTWDTNWVMVFRR
jgi:hypothetical protein